MGEPIRILVVDDHPVVRQGLRTFLDALPDLRVVGEAGDATSCLEQAAELQPDVILLDLRMPGGDGVTALRLLRQAGQPARVLVVTSYTEPAAVLPAMAAGAAGYVAKDVDPTALASAIRAVHAGHILLSPEVATLLTAGTAPGGHPARLTAREQDVLAEIARGRSNREIAKALGMAEKTVKTHVSAVLAKLGLADRTQAALYAVRNGMAGTAPDGRWPAAPTRQ